jgi:hypothetical protein
MNPGGLYRLEDDRASDTEDLLAVKAGTKQSWEVVPYATFQLEGINNDGGASIVGAAFDPETGDSS